MTKSTNYDGVYSKSAHEPSGVVVLPDGREILIKDENANYAMNGDEVCVSVQQRTGKVLHIINHNTHYILGTAVKNGKLLLLQPTHDVSYEVRIVDVSAINQLNNLEKNLLKCFITKYPDSTSKYFEVSVIERYEKHDFDKIFIEELLIENAVHTDFSDQVKLEVNKIKSNIAAAELKKRVDLRDLPFVTIDDIDAKDFDDAVYCKHDKKQKTFTLYVAIADVAHYVLPGTAIDEEAYSRGTSIYLPKMVINMLPERLSNEVCSLNPGVDRLVFCCEMEVNKNGLIKSYTVYPAVINSVKRLTYDEVTEYMNHDTAGKNIKDNIRALHQVYIVLNKYRYAKGAIDIKSTDTKFRFNQQGHIVELYSNERVEAHKLIEECMLAANVCAADMLVKNQHSAIFRVHEKPTHEKLTGLQTLLNAYGIIHDIDYENFSVIDYAKILSETEQHCQDKYSAIEAVAVKSMQLAKYSTNNVGHFGLNFDHYVHFTSPIRRYPDLLTHRILKDILRGKSHIPDNLSSIAEHASLTERRAESISRRVQAFYKCQYTNQYIGHKFNGVITAVLEFGAFVYIPELLIDGLLHVTSMGYDYFIYDTQAQFLIGRTSKKKYHLGQSLKIKIVSVDMKKLFINLSI